MHCWYVQRNWEWQRELEGVWSGRESAEEILGVNIALGQACSVCTGIKHAKSEFTLPTFQSVFSVCGHHFGLKEQLLCCNTTLHCGLQSRDSRDRSRDRSHSKEGKEKVHKPKAHMFWHYIPILPVGTNSALVSFADSIFSNISTLTHSSFPCFFLHTDHKL